MRIPVLTALVLCMFVGRASKIRFVLTDKQYVPAAKPDGTRID